MSRNGSQWTGLKVRSVVVDARSQVAVKRRAATRNTAAAERAVNECVAANESGGDEVVVEENEKRQGRESPVAVAVSLIALPIMN